MSDIVGLLVRGDDRTFYVLTQQEAMTDRGVGQSISGRRYREW